jgi:hypothetical protein
VNVCNSFVLYQPCKTQGRRTRLRSDARRVKDASEQISRDWQSFWGGTRVIQVENAEEVAGVCQVGGNGCYFEEVRKADVERYWVVD